jgi:hypothetical protein
LISLISHICNSLHHLLMIHLHLKLLLIHQQVMQTVANMGNQANQGST